MIKHGIAALAVACTVASAPVERAHADAASDFYRGKSLPFVISTATGGGYDA